MKVFISYSTAERTLAGDLQRQLTDHGVEAFLAHETIEVSAEWKARILSELTAANAMIVLLSKVYRKSKWTDHELGYYYAKTNHTGLIIPIRLDGTMPYGFFEHIQGRLMERGARSVPLKLWLKPLLDSNPDALIPVVIEKLASCAWARTSEAYMELLTDHYRTMAPSVLHRLMEAVSQNPNVFNASRCRDTHLPALVSANRDRLSQKQIAVLQGQFDRLVASDWPRIVLASSTMTNGG